MTEQKWTAADVSDEQLQAWSYSLRIIDNHKHMIAAACNIMGVDKPAASEWPADAPDWACVLVAGDNGYLWFAGVEAMGLAWVQRTRDYKGPRPASWDGKPWRECILRRPTVAAPAVDVERLAEPVWSESLYEARKAAIEFSRDAPAVDVERLAEMIDRRVSEMDSHEASERHRRQAIADVLRRELKRVVQ